jgi:hypothetical protein
MESRRAPFRGGGAEGGATLGVAIGTGVRTTMGATEGPFDWMIDEGATLWVAEGRADDDEGATLEVGTMLGVTEGPTEGGSALSPPCRLVERNDGDINVSHIPSVSKCPYSIAASAGCAGVRLQPMNQLEYPGRGVLILNEQTQSTNRTTKVRKNIPVELCY